MRMMPSEVPSPRPDRRPRSKMPCRRSKNNRRLLAAALGLLAAVLPAPRVNAQLAYPGQAVHTSERRPQMDSLSPPSTAPDTQDIARVVPKIELSGVLFANFQYRLLPDRDHGSNKFDVERAYLTFRARAGERISVRVTADLFQQTAEGRDSYYKGWSLRAKYAYMQYQFPERAGWQAAARIGLLHTVLIDHDERFWPRWISTTPTEAAGYFSSADAGVAASAIFPRKLGELYLTVTNGPGYISRETDRFKDYALRLTFAPWAGSARALRFLQLSAWGYKGAVGSAFAQGGAGQTGAVGSALRRNRVGAHLGAAHPNATFAIQYAWREDGGEAGDNTMLSPRLVSDSAGGLASAYAILRPLALARRTPIPLSVLARVDRVTSNHVTGLRRDVFIGGLIWDMSKEASVSVDYQRLRPGDTNPLPPSETFFVHFVARF